MNSLFEDLKEGLEQATEYERNRNMVWSDNAFPYVKHCKSSFEVIAEEGYDEGDDKICNRIEYSKELGMYRVTHFVNNHWAGDVVFDEVKK